MADARVARLARVLVDYSVNIQPNERVAIYGLPAAAPLIEAVYERVLERGAFPYLVLSLPGLEEIFLRTANEAQIQHLPIFQKTIMEEFEARISGAGGLTACPAAR